MKRTYFNSVGLWVTVVALICLSLTTTAFSQEAQTDQDYSFYTPSASNEPYEPMSGSKVKNVILLIGDGMGLTQVAAARIKATGADGRLYLEKTSVVGLARTHSADNLVTDSAASGTALSTGYKTNNEMVAVSPDGSMLRTILEEAGIEGRFTGLVVTSSITHATPAVFASHVRSRSQQADIAAELLDNRVNVLLGGGLAFFLPKPVVATQATTHPQTQPVSPSQRDDQRDLIAEARDAGYLVVETSEELRSADADYVLGLFALDAMTTRPPEPSLAELTRKAIWLLQENKKGFFLMVEGSQIDWACHRNDLGETIRQLLLFDQAVKTALDFARKDKHTLVIVTADHETGGMAITGGSLDGKDLSVKWTTTGHTAVPVPVYAYGPKATYFDGVYDNTDIPKKLSKLMGLELQPKGDD